MPSPSPDDLTAAEREVLLDIAEAALLSGLDGHAPRPPADDAPQGLRRPGAAFVTLRVGGALNGCIGTMEARDPLSDVVARMAWEAAFADPRLPALKREDLPELHIEISVLSAMEPIAAATREQLRQEITPGVHGVLVESGRARATLLPAVWARVRDADAFFDLLLRKAGLDPNPWPAGLRAYRYTASEFGRGPE